MADRIVTITESELLEFGRLAAAYGKHRDDFEIKERYLRGSRTISHIEVLYEGIRREYERDQGSSWLGLFGDDLASGRFDRKSSRARKGRPKAAPASSPRTIAAAVATKADRKSGPRRK